MNKQNETVEASPPHLTPGSEPFLERRHPNRFHRGPKTSDTRNTLGPDALRPAHQPPGTSLQPRSAPKVGTPVAKENPVLFDYQPIDWGQALERGTTPVTPPRRQPPSIIRTIILFGPCYK